MSPARCSGGDAPQAQRRGVRNTQVTVAMSPMTSPPTGDERYLTARLGDPAYRKDYPAARERIARVNAVIQMLDDRRGAMGLTKAELARRAGMKPEAVRRLLSAECPNPTLNTVVALAEVLGLELRPEPRLTPTPSVVCRTPAGTA